MATPSREKGLAMLRSGYRAIMRVHREKLPGPMRALGDDYVRSEFRSHMKGKTSLKQWEEFGTQWTHYLSLLKGEGDTKEALAGVGGEDVAKNVWDSMSEEQQQRMMDLKAEASRMGRVIMDPAQAEVDATPSQPKP